MKNNKVFAISLTVMWILALGEGMHNWSLGICLGLCLGMAFGLFESENEENKEEKKNNELLH